jgi:hypothetical protein
MRYKKEPKGRVATFLIPSVKLKIRMPDGRTVEHAIDEFLKRNYGNYLFSTITMSGEWSYVGMEFHGDGHRRFSFVLGDKGCTDKLDEFLCEIAVAIEQQAISVTAGEDAYTITPEHD